MNTNIITSIQAYKVLQESPLPLIPLLRKLVKEDIDVFKSVQVQCITHKF